MKAAKPKRRNAATANSAKGRSATSRTGATPTQTGRAAKPPNRAARAAQRRAAIIAAGLDEFTARGFAATRLDDVAKRAGVAKGTIYLHFKDKEALFQELVRTALVPLIGNLMTVPAAGGSVREILERFAETFVRDVAGTKRGDIVRLIMAEGTRFPSLADFYFREVVSRGLAGMRKLIEYGIERGEIRNARLADFPQIVIAPAMVAVMWQGLFGRHAPLDAVAMLKVHLDLIFGERRAS
jgi:AcrR family transcriptional regulator